jgi:hypothetical protein
VGKWSYLRAPGWIQGSVLSLRDVPERSGGRVENSELIALQEDDRDPTLASSGGEIIPDAKILAVGGHPSCLLDSHALLGRDRDATQHVLKLEGFSICSGRHQQDAGEGTRGETVTKPNQSTDSRKNGHGVFP